jgi:hypothetical protein
LFGSNSVIISPQVVAFRVDAYRQLQRPSQVLKITETPLANTKEAYLFSV